MLQELSQFNNRKIVTKEMENYIRWIARDNTDMTGYIVTEKARIWLAS